MGICGAGLIRLLDSISSPQFSVLILDVSDRETRPAESEGVLMEKLLDEVKMMDSSLCRFATSLLNGIGKRFTLILLGNKPATVARSLTKFREVGNTWEGERVIGGGKCDHYWTFRPARGCEAEVVDETVLSVVDL